jgi:hypothetical protein
VVSAAKVGPVFLHGRVIVLILAEAVEDVFSAPACLPNDALRGKHHFVSYFRVKTFCFSAKALH